MGLYSGEELLSSESFTIGVNPRIAPTVEALQLPFINDGEITGYLAELQQVLILASGRQAPEFGVFVVEDEAAWSRLSLGGLSLITTGLIESVQSESGLAARIALDLAVVMEGHPQAELAKIKRGAVPRIVLSVITGRDIPQPKGSQDPLSLEEILEVDTRVIEMLGGAGFDPNEYVRGMRPRPDTDKAELQERRRSAREVIGKLSPPRTMRNGSDFQQMRRKLGEIVRGRQEIVSIEEIEQANTGSRVAIEYRAGVAATFKVGLIIDGDEQLILEPNERTVRDLSPGSHTLRIFDPSDGFWAQPNWEDHEFTLELGDRSEALVVVQSRNELVRFALEVIVLSDGEESYRHKFDFQ